MHIDNYYSIYIQIEIIYKYIYAISIHLVSSTYTIKRSVLILLDWLLERATWELGIRTNTSHRVLGIIRGGHQPQITDIRITTGRDKTSYDAGLFCFVNIK